MHHDQSFVPASRPTFLSPRTHVFAFHSLSLYLSLCVLFTSSQVYTHKNTVRSFDRNGGTSRIICISSSSHCTSVPVVTRLCCKRRHNSNHKRHKRSIVPKIYVHLLRAENVWIQSSNERSHLFLCQDSVCVCVCPCVCVRVTDVHIITSMLVSLLSC